MTGRMDGGEAVLEAFRALGVDYVFCSPGSEWAPVWEAVTRQKVEQRKGPTYLDLWHEMVAVDMAIGYTLTTGRMQAVLLHAGAGLLQGSCGIHGALLTEVPLLVMSSDSNSYGERPAVDPGSQWYRNLSTVGGPHSLVDRFVKWSAQVPGIETLYEFVKRAGELAQRRPKAPVYLHVPVEVLLEPWEKPDKAKAVVAPGGRETPAAEVEALVSALTSAKAPIIVTESTGRTRQGFDALLGFAEAFGIPVYEPQSAVACNFPKSHRLYMGGNVDAARDDTDLVLLINCRSPWYPPSNVFPNARVLVLDEVPQRPHMAYQVLHADQYLEGDVAQTLRAATALAPADSGKARRGDIAARHDKLEAQWRQAEDKAAAGDAIDPVTLAVALREALPDNSLILDETITHSRIVQTHVRPETAGSYFYVQGGLGQGIGVALGAKLGSPGRFVVLTVGDGSLLYNPIVQALAASQTLGLPILVVVFNNRKYLSMKFNHLRYYPDGVSVEHDMFHGVDLAGQPALEALAGPCGAAGIAVADAAELRPRLAEAIKIVQGGQTTVLNVHLTR